MELERGDLPGGLARGEGELGAKLAQLQHGLAQLRLAFDAHKEVICVIGSKEAIAHFPFAFVNPGDVVLCPDPGYPVYATLTRFAGGEPYFLPLRRENGFLIDLDAIPADVARRAKILWINYPNNPTAALAAPGFYERVVAFAQKYEVIVASDLAYSEMYYESPPHSFLETPGAREVGIEFHSLSKTCNMTGWRVGWACGTLRWWRARGRSRPTSTRRVRGGAAGGIAALTGDQAPVARQRGPERRDVAGAAAAGFDVLTPRPALHLVANPGLTRSVRGAPADRGGSSRPRDRLRPVGGFVRPTVRG